MTSDRKSSISQRAAFVWIWLPGAVQPVVAGRIESDGGFIHFNYGKSYLARPDAIPIYEPELPLKSGRLPLLDALTMPGCIRDASPDAWGRRVILNRRLGLKGVGTDTAELDEITYLLESGSDRIGALDFQLSGTEYLPRHAENVTLEELMDSAERLEQGRVLTPELDRALFHGTSIGGARPKALIAADGIKYVAKFSSGSDLYSVVKAEFVAMRLAALAGLNVAPVRWTRAANRDVLLVQRFDRLPTDQGWTRRCMVSALTLQGMDEMLARYASYETFAEIIRHRFTEPKATLRELFSRLVFNILCGNTDDHARNHASFWEGKQLTLTPAYDICPQGRTGQEASQAMRIAGMNNLSQIKTCLAAAHRFLLDRDEARAIAAQQIATIHRNWASVCDEAALTTADRQFLWGRQFLNPYALVEE